MSRFRYGRAVALVVSATALAVPAAASAHPSVYTSAAKLVPSPPPSPIGYGDLTNETRYVVSNHGNSYVLKESNGQLNHGVVDYKSAPGAWRSQTSVSIADLVAAAATGVQAHSTCRTATLDNLDNITAWQEVSAAGKPEPFYDYVPFQKTSAALGDLPEEWIPLVKDVTGVDLATVSDDPGAAATELEALCEALPGPGVFVPADATVTLATAFNSSTIALQTDPLNAQIDSLSAEIARLQADLATARQTAGAAQAQAGSNAAQVAQLKAAALSIDPSGTLSTGQLTGGGLSAKVTGPVGKSVTVRISAAKAKALRLKSRVLATATAKLGADGTALVKLTAGGKAKSALKKAKKSVKVAFEVISGDRAASTAHSLSH